MLISPPRTKRTCLTFGLGFLEQEIEFAGPNIVTDLFIPSFVEKFLIPLIKPDQFFFGQSLNGSFDFSDAHQSKVR